MTHDAVSNTHVEQLHRAGIKAEFVHRLRSEKYAAGDGQLAAAHFGRLAHELDVARRTIWEMVKEMGFDQDGAEYWHLTLPPLNVYGLQKAREFRAEYDSTLEAVGEGQWSDA